MEDYQHRVLDEQVDLSEKIKKLSAFLGSPRATTLGVAERARMNEQLIHMARYNGVLLARIRAFQFPV